MQDKPQYIVDIENEQTILATLLQKPEMYKLFEVVSSEIYFLNQAHKQTIKAIKILKDKQLDFSLDTLVIIGKENNLHLDIEYLLKVINTYPALSEDNFKAHCQKLKTDYFKHKMISQFIPKLMEISYKPLTKIDDISVFLRTHLRELELSATETDITLKNAKELFEDYNNRDKTFVTTGFATLDHYLTKGFFPGGLTVIAARPGCGKSSMIVNMILRLINSQIPITFFSLEMDSYSVLERLIAITTNIPLFKISKFTDALTTQEKNLLEYQLKYLKENPYLFISDFKKTTLDKIYQEIYKFKQIYKYNFAIVFIDLIDKLRDLKELHKSSGNLARAYEVILDEIQAIAKELNVHFCITAQISREAESKKDKRPRLAHLKHSGGLEQNADLVLLLYREKYYNPNIQEDILELTIGKQRFGIMNYTLEFLFLEDTTKILPIAPEHYSLDEMDIQHL